MNPVTYNHECVHFVRFLASILGATRLSGAYGRRAAIEIHCDSGHTGKKMGLEPLRFGTAVFVVDDVFCVEYERKQMAVHVWR